MGIQARKVAVTAAVTVLMSAALVFDSAEAHLEEGASSPPRRVPQEIRAVAVSSVTPSACEAESKRTVREQHLRRELEALGIWVD